MAFQQVLVPIGSSCPLGGEQGISRSLRPESYLPGGLLGQATLQDCIETVGPAEDAGALVFEALEQPHIGALIAQQRHLSTHLKASGS